MESLVSGRRRDRGSLGGGGAVGRRQSGQTLSEGGEVDRSERPSSSDCCCWEMTSSSSTSSSPSSLAAASDRLERTLNSLRARLWSTIWPLRSTRTTCQAEGSDKGLTSRVVGIRAEGAVTVDMQETRLREKRESTFPRSSEGQFSCFGGSKL